MGKSLFIFLIFFWSLINSANLSWSPRSKRVTGEDPERSQYVAAPVCWCSRPGSESGELEGHCCSALVPKGHRLDAGKDFPLMPGQSHSHVQQIPEHRKIKDIDLMDIKIIFQSSSFCSLGFHSLSFYKNRTLESCGHKD